MNQPQGQPQLNVSVDIKELPSLKCEKCDCETFIPAQLIKIASPMITTTGKIGYVPIPTFACVKCGHVNDALNPLKQTSLVKG
jgi:hypothetical protein